jgi:uncharacterized protein
MTQTVFGPALDMLGFSVHEELAQGEHGPIVERHFQSIPAGGVRVVQPEKIPIDYCHTGPELGQVIYAERTSRYLWLVGQIRDDVSPAIGVKINGDVIPVETAMFWSGMFDSNMAGKDTVIRSAAVTPRPAQTCLEPLVWLEGGLDCRTAWRRWNLPHGYPRQLLERACMAHLDRRRNGGPIIVVDHGPGTRPAAGTSRYERTARPMIETRSATVADVAVDKREIVARVVPYGSDPATVVIKGKVCREVIAPGAFDTVTEQRHAIRLNMNHNAAEVVGRAVDWYTGRSDGLIGVFKVSKTVAGDEALALAADDCVDCSIGFGVIKESWPQRDLRVVHEGFVDHVALTSAPAYPDAQVLGVRSGNSLAAVR